MGELETIIIAGIVGFISALLLQIVIHRLSIKREKQKWLRETPDRLSSEVREYHKIILEMRQLIAKYEEMVFEKEQLLAKIQDEVDGNDRTIEKLTSRERELLQGTIILKNQLRDALLGYDKNKMKFRANKIKTIINEMDVQELLDIAEGKKPLPDIPD